MSNTKKLAFAGIFSAIGVVCSAFYIPIGVAKCFPVQSLINVVAGVLLGPLYAVCMAFVTSLIRVLMGTGTLLAFPGSMCGALLCGLLYKYTKSTVTAFAGEVFGTGIIGAILAYPIASLFLSKTVALFGFVIPFGLSSLLGGAISLVLLGALNKTHWMKILVSGGKNNGI
jgi:energy coupling factor transporter S component ThiW